MVIVFFAICYVGRVRKEHKSAEEKHYRMRTRRDGSIGGLVRRKYENDIWCRVLWFEYCVPSTIIYWDPKCPICSSEPMNGIRVFKKRDPPHTLLELPWTFYHMRTQGEVGCLQLKRGLLPEPDCVDTFIMNLQPPEL